MTLKEQYDRDVKSKRCWACDIPHHGEGCFLLDSCGPENKCFQPMGFAQYVQLHGAVTATATVRTVDEQENKPEDDREKGTGMSEGTFRGLLVDQIERCKTVLGAKSDEYGPTDRLHNFRVAAALQNQTLEQALSGMMAKHTISVYDMCRESGEKEFPIELWQEKITDHINYLLLLNAAVREREAQRNAEAKTH